MIELHLEGLYEEVAKDSAPFFEEILRGYPDRVHSLHIVGSAITPDFHPKHSDINSVIILPAIDFGFMKFLGALGKKYRKNRLAAPLIMTPQFIEGSLDLFPMEFLDLKTIHRTVYGPDIFADLQVQRSFLRLQCEREIETRLFGLRQGYISSLGEKDLVIEVLSKSITGCMPLFRGIIYLLGKEPPVRRHDVVETLEKIATEACKKSQICIDRHIFEKVLSVKHKELKPSREDLHLVFENYYLALETVDKLIDELPV